MREGQVATGEMTAGAVETEVVVVEIIVVEEEEDNSCISGIPTKEEG